MPTYDYRRPGLYFVTICAARWAPLFGEVRGDRVALSALGRIARDEWVRTLDLRPYLVPDAFVVMPNHVHLLIGISSEAVASEAPMAEAPPMGPGVGGSPARSVPTIVGAYKGAVTRRARAEGLWPGGPLWQARFHDRVVRHDAEAGRVRRYIAENPARWSADRLRT